MVTVKDFKVRGSKDGEEFFVLVLQGGVMPVKSKATGRTYFTAKTCTVPSTFDEETCKSIVGSQFPGQIVRVEAEPYEYTVPETGEIITLEHRWEYRDATVEDLEVNVIEESEVL